MITQSQFGYEDDLPPNFYLKFQLLAYRAALLPNHGLCALSISGKIIKPDAVVWNCLTSSLLIQFL